MLLTVKDVAERFQVSVKTVNRWVKDGKLRMVRLGPRMRRFRLAEITKLEERLLH